MGNKLPKGWEWKQLLDIAKISNETILPAKNKNYNYIGLENIESETGRLIEFNITEGALIKSSKVHFRKNMVLYGKLRPYLNKVWVADFDGICTTEILPFITESKVLNSVYLAYYFRSPKFLNKVNKHTSGARMPRATTKFFKNVALVPLPPLPEQKRIVTKLDALFERIDKAIHLLEENIEHTRASMDAVLGEVFGRIDSRYPKTPLLKYVDFIGGSQPPKSNFSKEKKEGYIRLIQIRDYKTDNHVVYIKESATKKFCKANDIMIGRYGPPVFQILRGLEGAYNVALMKAIPNPNKISKEYLFWFLKNPSIQNYIIGISQRSAGQSGVNKKALEAYEISIPSLELQESISNYLTQSEKKKELLLKAQQQKLKSLQSLKTSLLDKAFKGEL